VADVTTPFDPEFVTSYELGSKLDLYDRRLRFNAAVFWNDYDNKQEETIQPGPPPSFTSTTVRNASAARIRGVEVEVSARPVPELRINGSLGYLDAKYTNFTAFIGSGQYVSTPAQPAGTLIQADLSTLELRRAPEWSGAIGATYTTELGFGEFSLNGNARYVDEQYGEFFNSRRGLIPSNWKIDASASLEFGGSNNDQFRLTVFGENLTNKQYFTGFTNSLVDFSTRSQPRMYGVELSVNF
jgi:iron complex outermembrane receptor protein